MPTNGSRDGNAHRTISFGSAVTLAALVVTLISCHSNDIDRADTHEYHLNEPFVLGGGQDVLISGANLRLHFAKVIEDSRCPTQHQCYWAGQARIVIAAQLGESSSQTVEFYANRVAPRQKINATNVGEYAIELQSLDPYPQTDDPISFGDYRATLVVRHS